MRCCNCWSACRRTSAEAIVSLDWLAAAAAAWALGAVFAASMQAGLARAAIALGCAAGIVGALLGLPAGSGSGAGHLALAGQPVNWVFTPDALWLLGLGLAPAGLAAALGTPARDGRCGWLFGLALALIGALGVFGLQDAAALLVAWELMSLGGAVMLLAERLGPQAGAANLFMLALLEVGAVALLLALLLLGRHDGGTSLSGFAAASAVLGGPAVLGIGVLLLIGFGAKLGVLPFYEWVPQAYGVGSGASGAVLSGVVLNAAYFGLSRGLLQWLPAGPGTWHAALATVVIAAGVLSAVLAILYAFQQEDWRMLLAFSSAENAGIAVTLLGAAMLFREDGEAALAGLAWLVALMHLGGHALAKGSMFLAADGVFRSRRSYHIEPSGLLRRSAWPLGLGALFGAMSLAALPPQAGFVTEWFAFQTLFQTLHLSTLSGRLTLALAGAGLALTAAIALATFVKLFGLGLLGDGAARQEPAPTRAHGAAVLVLGLLVLALAVGMLGWMQALGPQSRALFGVDAAAASHSGWLLVPLRADFAFISPALLVVVMPLLALLPLALLRFNMRRHASRRAPVWWGGMVEDTARSTTTALSFSNAMRTFYGFIYRPVLRRRAEHEGLQPYFVRRLVFNYRIAPLFGPLLFRPATLAVWWLAGKFRALQSGDLNLYLALIGLLLVAILALSLV
jgi:formate hydrogenlyase subunit 3/multisubunit Na+/H+ antiporter MnhD subunit